MHNPGPGRPLSACCHMHVLAYVQFSSHKCCWFWLQDPSQKLDFGIRRVHANPRDEIMNMLRYLSISLLCFISNILSISQDKLEAGCDHTLNEQHAYSINKVLRPFTLVPAGVMWNMLKSTMC